MTINGHNFSNFHKSPAPQKTGGPGALTPVAPPNTGLDYIVHWSLHCSAQTNLSAASQPERSGQRLPVNRFWRHIRHHPTSC